jgi:hypothetical protein
MSRVAHLCSRSLMESVSEVPLVTKFVLTKISIVPGGLPGFPYLGLSESRWVCVGRLGMSVSEERLLRSPGSTHPRNHITLQVRSNKTHTSRILKSNHAPRVAEESIKLAREIHKPPAQHICIEANRRRSLDSQSFTTLNMLISVGNTNSRRKR